MPMMMKGKCFFLGGSAASQQLLSIVLCVGVGVRWSHRQIHNQIAIIVNRLIRIRSFLKENKQPTENPRMPDWFLT
jgi:hypothetical protein